MDNYCIAPTNHIRDAEIHKNLKSIKRVNTAFGYFGAKNRIANQICEFLPSHNCWVEAFCGSAAITLYKRKAPIEIINDIDNNIINLFQQLRDNQIELCRLVALTPYSKKEFENSRITNSLDSDLEKARKFLVQAMMAVNGVFGKDKGGFSYSQSYSRNGRDARVNRWYNLPDRLTDVVERLRNVRVENRNAIEVLEMFIKRPATLVYLDPPYLADRTEGYVIDSFDLGFHMDLLNMASKAKCMILISGYDNEFYNSHLTEQTGWKRRTINTTTKDIKGQAHFRKEIVWFNKHFEKASISGKVPIRLTKKEQAENKVNPERK
jgi:DNA adenine methylase